MRRGVHWLKPPQIGQNLADRMCRTYSAGGTSLRTTMSASVPNVLTSSIRTP